MTITLPLLREENGIVREWVVNNDGTYTVTARQENETEILDRNKAMFTHNDGYAPTRELRRIGTIPQIVMEMWTKEINYPACGLEALEAFISKKMDDPDWLWLRTAPGRVGRKHRHI